MVKKIVTGGQTGVDQAALEAAMSLGLDYGGWCPEGRAAENGEIPKEYVKLKVIPKECYQEDKEDKQHLASRAARTKKNIEDSDATLIIVPQYPIPDAIKDGTKLTIDYPEEQKKPFMIFDLSKQTAKDIATWINKVEKETGKAIETLNIGGPSESNWPGINKQSLTLLKETFPLVCKLDKTSDISETSESSTRPKFR